MFVIKSTIFILICYSHLTKCEPALTASTTNITEQPLIEDIVNNNIDEETNDNDEKEEEFVLHDPKDMLHVTDGVFHDDIDQELSDEEKDAKILVDVIASIAEWKDRQQKKILHYLFHRQKRDEEVVCYGELGCFRDEGPFNYLDMLPSPPDEIGTVFYLYTRLNDETPQFLDYLNTTTISSSNYNVSLPTKIIIHGFGSSCKKIWPREMRLSFLLVEDCNVICVDWEAGAVDPNYVRAAVNTRLVGKQVAALINKISSETGVTINNNTHLVGFSLGAHVSGFVGKELRNLSRITGLDPAGPLFEGYTPNVRLDKTDADFVDVIHSNGDSLIIGGLGAWEPIGHVDFYPNGGKAQRGCQNLLIGGLYDFIYSYSTKNESYRYLCNHRRAYKLFTDSISPKCKFTAFPCESYEKFESGQCFSCGGEEGDCGQLGYRSNQSPGRGSLYLLTREDEPFCAAQFKIQLMFTGSRLPIYTYGALQIKLINKEGVNETYTLTNTHDELLTSGAKIEKLIVAHPALSQPTEVQILYTSYEGWIYSGREVWSVEKLILSDGYGNARSWCKEHGELLPNNVPVNVALNLGECSTTLPPVVDKGSLLPSEELTAPAPPASNLPAKVRPPLTNNDISKHSDILENNIPSAGDSSVTISDSAAQFNLNTIPRPVLVPVKPQLTVIPVKPNPPPPVKHDQYQWNNKQNFNPRPPIQPYHLQGPPGAWNVVTSKPGLLPPPIHVYQSKLPLQNHNNEGIEIQLGPRLPLPPLHKSPFPPRRRPSTPIVKPPVHDILDMSTSNSDQSVLFSSSTENHLPATERVDQLPEADVIVIESNQLNRNNTLDDNKSLNSSKDSIKNDILSDDQLTIFKVGPDNDIVRVSNDTAENDTDTETRNDYKFVILHKLPNGNAVNLENLKTYNYEDLIKGHSSVIEDANQEEIFDRENLEFFDVPRKVTNDRKDPYIIYQLPEKLTDVKTPAGVKNVYSPSVKPVYKPVHTVHRATDAKNQTITTPTTDPNTYAANSSITINTNEWIPKNKTDKPTLSLDSLSELSQLAEVSITDKGPIKIPASVASIPPKLNVQLLPPRLSAVLSHLDTTYKERDSAISKERSKDRSSNSRSVGTPLVPNFRQNKVSPAFQLGGKSRGDKHYARRIHNSDYVVTQPYQTQVIPSNTHRYIPLLHHPKMPLWWHPQDKQYQLPMRPHFILKSPTSHNKISKPPIVNNNHEIVKDVKHDAKKNVTLARNAPIKLPYQKFHKGPIYIISHNQSLSNLPKISKHQMNEQNEELSTVKPNNNTFSTDLSTISPMHNFTLTTEHLSPNASSESYQPSQIFLGQMRSADDQLLREEASTQQVITSHYQMKDNAHNDNPHNNVKKELSEINESSNNPVSGS